MIWSLLIQEISIHNNLWNCTFAPPLLPKAVLHPPGARLAVPLALALKTVKQHQPSFYNDTTVECLLKSRYITSNWWIIQQRKLYLWKETDMVFSGQDHLTGTSFCFFLVLIRHIIGSLWGHHFIIIYSEDNSVSIITSSERIILHFRTIFQFSVGTEVIAAGQIAPRSRKPDIFRICFFVCCC